MKDAPWTRFDDALLGACAVFPATLAAAGAASAAPASHDDAVVRVAGLGFTGIFRGLDAILAAPLALVPLGTRSLRASLACALVLGACGMLSFVASRALSFAVRPASSPRLVSAVAAVAVLAALLSPVWQTEGSSVGGTVVGALLVILALVTASRAMWPALGLAIGLSASYEPLVLLASLAAATPWLARAKLEKAVVREAAIAFALGLAPALFALALSTRTPELSLASAPLFASPLGEAAGARTPVVGWVRTEVGAVILIAAGGGAALLAMGPRFVATLAAVGEETRTWLASLVALIVVGVFALLLGAASGPGHVAAPLLVASLALHLLAAIALAAVVEAIRRAPVPFAQASASLVVVLELVLPVRAADETSSRREVRSIGATLVWNEAAWGAAPAAAVVMVTDPRVMRRVTAARAVGDFRPDLLVVPTFAIPSRLTDRALAKEPKLAPLYRDVSLGSAPEELSLTQLASARPLLAAFDPAWDRNLARHFIPVGLTTRFEPEPRGSSDRRRALDAFTPIKDRLVRVALTKKDPDLAIATATQLRGRAIGIAACGERDVLERALNDLRPFAPDDPVANTLVRRIVANKGAIEVKDLRP